MPDLRAHGESARPHDHSAYPGDVLAGDGFALIRHLGLEHGDYDLGGYSLGARTVVRLLVRGARPRRAVLAGLGQIGRASCRARVWHYMWLTGVARSLQTNKNTNTT